MQGQKLVARLFPHMPQFFIAWGVFLASGLVAYLIHSVRSGERLRLKGLLNRCIPFDLRSNRSFRADVKVFFIDSFTGLPLAVPGILLTGMLGLLVDRVLAVSHAGPQAPELNAVAAGFCGMVMFLLAEFSDYLAHYLEHKVPELWELHKLHHAVQILNPFTARRLHPISILFNGLLRGLVSGIPAGLLLHFFRITIAEAVALSLVASKIFSMASLNPLKHSHHPVGFGPFDRFLISPHMHQIHHSRLDKHVDKNFGTHLSVFDWLFGTAYKPARGEVPEFGIAGYDQSELELYFSMRGAYMQPLINFFRTLQKRYPNHALQQERKRRV